MMEYRSKWLVIIFCTLLLIVLYSLADRMVIHRDKYFSSRFTDRAFVELMETLISENVFIIHGERIAIDEASLDTKVAKKSTRERVRNTLPYLFVKNEVIHFDSQSVSISNNRTWADELVMRGCFLDRNDLILARSDMDERTWKQKRIYTSGAQFYHIIGHWNRVYGTRNLENELDDYLCGLRHPPVYRKTSDPMKKLRIGDDIFLTLDAAVQRHAYNLLGDKRGAVVVIDIRTGEIIVAVSTPSFDPNTKEWNAWQEAFNDVERKPYENRAFAAQYPPGSTFKTVVASAWIEQEAKDAGRNGLKVYCNGKMNKFGISDIHAHRTVDFEKAYVDSCNLFFSEAGVMLGRQLLEYALLFGFNNKWDLLPQMTDHEFISAESTAFTWNGKLPGERGKEFDVRDFRRNPKLIAQGAIGQNVIMATPLQMAMVAATVANSGIMQAPYIVKEIRTGDGKTTQFSAKPLAGKRVIGELTASKLKNMMEKVMQNGTGKDVQKIYLDGGRYYVSTKAGNGKIVRIAGKTGTADVVNRNDKSVIDPEKRPHSWFIGFAPADNPKFAIAVIAENQGFGSLTAAPIAVDVLAEALNSAIK